MTETEWFASHNPTPMLELLSGRASARTLRLFACAAAGHLRAGRPDGCLDRWQADVAAVERAVGAGAVPAEGGIVAREWTSVAGTFRHRRTPRERPAVSVGELLTPHAVVGFVRAGYEVRGEHTGVVIDVLKDGRRVRPGQAVVLALRLPHDVTDRYRDGVPARLLRCVAGNPFRPVAFDPAWLTADVRLLARGIDEEKAFDRMPILADALMDAGCADGEVLAHCRACVHVRGCWLIDRLRGRQ